MKAKLQDVIYSSVLRGLGHIDLPQSTSVKYLPESFVISSFVSKTTLPPTHTTSSLIVVEILFNQVSPGIQSSSSNAIIGYLL